MKIGVFDSGIGGVTVLNELRRRFPGVSYIYLGDTAHVPYGTKSPAQIRQLSAACARVLKSRKIDALVVACNTASSLAMDAIRDAMAGVPVFGVVEPGIDAAMDAIESISSKQKSRIKPVPVLVLATRATVKSGAYGKGLMDRQASFSVMHPVIEQPCPLLVPMIEEGWVSHPILKRTIVEYVSKHKKFHRAGVALLGCTHYPWARRAFQEALPQWMIVDSAQAVVRTLMRSSLSEGLSKARRGGTVEWIFTDPDAVPAFALKFTENEGLLSKV